MYIYRDGIIVDTRNPDACLCILPFGITDADAFIDKIFKSLPTEEHLKTMQSDIVVDYMGSTVTTETTCFIPIKSLILSPIGNSKVHLTLKTLGVNGETVSRDTDVFDPSKYAYRDMVIDIAKSIQVALNLVR